MTDNTYDLVKKKKKRFETLYIKYFELGVARMGVNHSM
jgi:hypothetical protein